MKGFGLLPTLARSASTIAVATGLAIPGVAMAQTAYALMRAQGVPLGKMDFLAGGAPVTQAA